MKTSFTIILAAVASSLATVGALELLRGSRSKSTQATLGLELESGPTVSTAEVRGRRLKT